MRSLISALILLCISFPLLAQDTSALINEQLDRPVAKLELNGTLPQVMNTIGEQTGVRLEASSAVWDLLPAGQGTIINAKIENHTLRQALEAITRKLGLTFVPGPLAIITKPYMGRAACVNCGICSGYGCQVRARSSSAVTMLP